MHGHVAATSSRTCAGQMPSFACRYLWVIKNFPDLRANIGAVVCHQFDVLDAKWALCLYTGGVDANSQGFVSISLSSASPLHARFQNCPYRRQ